MKECDLPCGCYFHKLVVCGRKVTEELRCAEHSKMEWDKIVKLARHWKPTRNKNPQSRLDRATKE